MHWILIKIAIMIFAHAAHTRIVISIIWWRAPRIRALELCVCVRLCTWVLFKRRIMKHDDDDVMPAPIYVFIFLTVHIYYDYDLLNRAHQPVRQRNFKYPSHIHNTTHILTYTIIHSLELYFFRIEMQKNTTNIRRNYKWFGRY